MAFAASALVFPGGAVDAGDHALAATIADGLPLDEAAARIAAVRETLEESGLAIAFTSPPGPERITSCTSSARRAWTSRRKRKSEEHTSELQSLMRISYAVFCLKKKTNNREEVKD